MNYLDRAKDLPIPAIAERLGLETVQRGTSIAFGPCPECGSETRHANRRDKRLACGMKQPFVGFKCHECGLTGDAISLVCAAIGGNAKFGSLTVEARQQVSQWWADYFGDVARTAAPRAPRVAIEREPNYPPLQVVRAIWEASRRADEDAEVVAWCADKRVDATRAADLDTFRVLPKRGLITSDTASDESIGMWLRNDMRAVFPLFDVTGDLRSLKARSVLPKAKRKNPTPSLPFKGYDKAGLVNLCPVARQVLSACRLPDWWADYVEPWSVIVEGEAKFAEQATAYGELEETAPMTIGIESGVRFDRLFARLPERVRILVATDPNDAGAGYASKALAAMSQMQRGGALFAEWFEVAADGGAAKVVVTS